MKTILTQTGLGYTKIHTNQAVLISTKYKPIQGLLLSPGPKKSLVRLVENERITEKRIDNKIILPLQLKKTRRPTSGQI